MKGPLGEMPRYFACFFVSSFPEARALYGIAASVHAFLEWPLFLALACGGEPEPAPA